MTEAPDNTGSDDVWATVGFARLKLRQGDWSLIIPLYRDVLSVEGLVIMGNYLDTKLLAAAGHVLPTREWEILQG